MIEKLLKSLEEQTKKQMDDARSAWLIEQWYPSFWSIFKNKTSCPPRYVSKEEADKALERLKEYGF